MAAEKERRSEHESGPEYGADEVEVQIIRLDPGLDLPGYAHPDDAGADLRITEDLELAPGERRLVGTGVALALPEGYAGFVHPRSGLAARHGLSIVNAPGTVDAGYRGEIFVCLINTDLRSPLRLSRGDRIAQLVIQRISRARFRSVAQLPGSSRGAAGHGSSGGFGSSDRPDQADAGTRLEISSVRTTSQEPG